MDGNTPPQLLDMGITRLRAFQIFNHVIRAGFPPVTDRIRIQVVDAFIGHHFGHETSLQRLVSVEVRFRSHHRVDCIKRNERSRVVDTRNSVSDLIHRIGHRPHVASVAHDDRPRIVNHEDGIFRHRDIITSHCNKAGGRHGSTVNLNSHACLMPLERIVDCLPVVHVAAIAVQSQRNVVNAVTQRIDRPLKLSSRNTLNTLADITIKNDLGRAVTR